MTAILNSELQISPIGVIEVVLLNVVLSMLKKKMVDKFLLILYGVVH